MQQLINTLAAAAPKGAPTGDKQLASSTAHALLTAAAAAKDPQLKAALSTALAALHKYVAALEKEQHAAMGGKVSPRLMSQAYGK